MSSTRNDVSTTRQNGSATWSKGRLVILAVGILLVAAGVWQIVPSLRG
jgi:hypothetical protein